MDRTKKLPVNLPEIGEVFAGRFEILEKLSQPDATPVFKARDSLNNSSLVAVKILSSDNPLVESIKSEFEALHSLSHPCLARAVAFGKTSEDQWYLATEFIDGMDFLSWASATNPEAIESATVHLLDALEYLHSNQILHRDLKPENVLVVIDAKSAAFEMKLIDFGLSSSMDPSEQILEGVSGTLKYMAPEILKEAPPTPQSDLYSLGFMLYEALASEPPFGSGDIREMLGKKLFDAPKPLNDLNPEVAPNMENAVMRMLSTEPMDRFASAEGAKLALRPDDKASLKQNKPPALRVIFGRDKELVEIDKALSSLGSDEAVSLLIFRASPGMGKTRMVEETIHRASLKGLLIINASATGHASGLESLAAQLSALTGKDADLQDKALTLQYMESMFSEIGRHCVIAVDDLHRWPSDQVEMLTMFAASSATTLSNDARPLLVVSILTGVDIPGLKPGERVSEKLTSFMKIIDLGPLDMASSKTLFKKHLKGLPPQTLTSACEAASGEPWLIEQLILLLSSRTSEGQLPDDFKLPDGVGSILESRFQGLGKEERELAGTMSLIGVGVTDVIIAGLKKASPDEISSSLDILVDSGIARVETSSSDSIYELVEWAGPLALKAMDESSITPEIRGGIIEELIKLDPIPNLKIADHYKAIGDDKCEVAHLMKAAHIALENRDPEPASELADRALRISRESNLPDQAGIAHKLVEALMKAADYEKALSVMDELSEIEGSEPENNILLLERAKALEKLGRAKEALKAMDKAVEVLEGDARLEALSLKSQSLMAQSRYKEAADVAAEGLKLSKKDIDKAKFKSLLALESYYRGESEQAFDGFSESLGLLEKADADQDELSRAHSLKAMALQSQGKTDEALGYHEQALELARGGGDLKSLPTYIMNLATAHHALNNFDDALKLYREAQALAAAKGSEAELANILANLGNLLLYFGDLTEASNTLNVALELSRKMGLRSIEAYGLLVLGDIEKEQGNLKAAMLDYENASRLLEALGSRAQSAEAMLKVSTCALDLKEMGKAEKFAARSGDMAEELGLKEIAGRCRMNLSLVALENSHATKALKIAGEALELARKLGKQSFMWEALWAAGKAEFALGHMDKAKSLFEEAVKNVDEMKQSMPAILQDRFLKGARWENLQESLSLAKTAMSSSTQDENLKKLLEINKRLTSEHDPKKLLQFIMDSVLAILNAERGFMVLMEGRGQESKIAVARNIDRETISKPLFKISRSIAERVAQTGAPVLTIDAKEDPRFDESVSVHDLKLRSIICVPLRGRERVIGTLYADNRFQSGAFRQNDLDLMEAFADQAAIAIENAKLIEENIKKNIELENSRARIEAMAKRLEKKVVIQQQEIESIREDLEQSREKLFLKYNYEGIIGASESVKEVLKLLDRITDSNVSVLIEGESGTGKELVAKAIHYNGPRRKAKFVTENVSAIPETLLESELFGHEKGAFTGAYEQKRGLFEIAHNGTLFLDEIGDMSMGMQAKLLRALQEGEIRRVGGKDIVHVDVRIISATNKDISSLIEEKRFREDLYYRLNVVRIPLAPLRERRDDIPLLAAHFIREETGGREDIKVDPAAMALFMDHEWPGNVRELANEIRRAILIGAKIIRPEHLSDKIRSRPETEPAAQFKNRSKSLNLKQALEIEEERAIRNALEEAKGNRVQAAKILGIGRRTLYMKLEKYGL